MKTFIKLSQKLVDFSVSSNRKICLMKLYSSPVMTKVDSLSKEKFTRNWAISWKDWKTSMFALTCRKAQVCIVYSLVRKRILYISSQVNRFIFFSTKINSTFMLNRSQLMPLLNRIRKVLDLIRINKIQSSSWDWTTACTFLFLNSTKLLIKYLLAIGWERSSKIW